MEGFWSLLRSWLRPHRGISQEKLPLYLGFFEFVHNVRKRGKALLGALIELLVSATAWKCTKTGKMKMVRFSGIKFATGLAYETHNPPPPHEIRRKRIRRQIFSMDAKKKIVHFHTAGINTVSGHR